MRRSDPVLEVVAADPQQADLGERHDVHVAAPVAQQLGADQRVRAAHRRPDLVAFRAEGGHEDGALADDEHLLEAIALGDDDVAGGANDLARLDVPRKSEHTATQS